VVLVSCSVPSVAQDGAALYRANCLSCHGPTGAGRPAIKGSDLLGDRVKNMSDANLTEAIAYGGKSKNAAHAYSKQGVNPEQIQTLVAYVRELQSKK
jgi:mono/diheme cytochrome c family protein